MPNTNILNRVRQMQSAVQTVQPSADAIRHIVVVGGGSAGWMCAAALSNVLGSQVRITLVESEQIGTVGVGEATLPTIRLLNQTMGVDEKAFMRATKGTFKLGIEFVNWGREGHRYFHPFGALGLPFDGWPVHQHWLRHREEADIGPMQAYSLAWQAAERGHFSLPGKQPHALNASFNYAFHFDASLYAAYLRKLSEARGVQRIEGQITQVHRHPETGFVTSVQLDEGRGVTGDLFIDCSGFKSLLLGQALGVEYESWSNWLPCDRAVAMPCTLEGAPAPFTRSTALGAGWQWTIPLQHRVGNGYVFSSNFLSESQASDTLAAQLPGAALGSPRLLQFTAGRRQQAWSHNVVALGLSSGFLEPLESTSLHLVHSGIMALLSLFPDRHCHASLSTEYNRLMALQMERIRDFLILHYKLTERRDSEMWRYCANMTVPDSLQERLALYRHSGHLQLDEHDLFGPESWLAVHTGQLNFPQKHAPLMALLNTDGRQKMQALRQALVQTAQAMPSHSDFLTRYLA